MKPIKIISIIVAGIVAVLTAAVVINLIHRESTTSQQANAK